MNSFTFQIIYIFTLLLANAPGSSLVMYIYTHKYIYKGIDMHLLKSLSETINRIRPIGPTKI